LGVGRVRHNRVCAGKTADAAHVKARVHVHQSQIVIVLVAGKATVRYLVWPAALAVAAKRQIARHLAHQLPGLRARVASAIQAISYEGAAQVVAVDEEETVIVARRVAGDPCGDGIQRRVAIFEYGGNLKAPQQDITPTYSSAFRQAASPGKLKGEAAKSLIRPSVGMLSRIFS
jgi:hypothetical protein